MILQAILIPIEFQYYIDLYKLETVCSPHSNSGYSVQESIYQCVLKSNQQAYLVVHEIGKNSNKMSRLYTIDHILKGGKYKIKPAAWKNVRNKKNEECTEQHIAHARTASRNSNSVSCFLIHRQYLANSQNVNRRPWDRTSQDDHVPCIFVHTSCT